MASPGSAAFTVKTSIPNGGVNSPHSIARMPRIANASGSNPSAIATGANTGTVSRMIEIESIRQPSTNQIATMIASTPKDRDPTRRRAPWPPW